MPILLGAKISARRRESGRSTDAAVARGAMTGLPPNGAIATFVPPLNRRDAAGSDLAEASIGGGDERSDDHRRGRPRAFRRVRRRRGTDSLVSPVWKKRCCPPRNERRRDRPRPDPPGLRGRDAGRAPPLL